MYKIRGMKLSKSYLSIILLFMLVFPWISIAVDKHLYHPSLLLLDLVGKWFTFWAIGLRLFTAWIRQVTKPAFTAKNIFHLDGEECQVIIKELGYANICLGATAIISLFIPQWRVAAAFAGGLYMGIAGINHIIKRPETPNEVVAMVSDIFILIVMAVYIVSSMM